MSEPYDLDENPSAFEAEITCACGREYRAMVTQHDRSYDSPGWLEPEPGEEACPTCRALDALADDITKRVRAWLEVPA